MTVASLYYDEESCIKILSQESTKLHYNSVSSAAKINTLAMSASIHVLEPWVSFFFHLYFGSFQFFYT